MRNAETKDGDHVKKYTKRKKCTDRDSNTEPSGLQDSYCCTKLAGPRSSDGLNDTNILNTSSATRADLPDDVTRVRLGQV